MAEPTTGVRFAGVLRDGSGNLITSGVTANSYNIGTTTPQRGTEDSTFTNGKFAINDSGFGRFDVKIVNGSEQIWWSSLAEVQVTTLHARNYTTASAALEVFSTTDETSSLVAVFGFRPSTESSGVESAALPANGDNGYINFELPNNHTDRQQFTAARIAWEITDVTDESEDAQLNFWTMVNGTPTEKLHLSGAALWPEAAAGLDLGTAALGFNDLHLDNLGVINFNGGDVTLTHGTGTLTYGGDGAVSVAFGANVDLQFTGGSTENEIVLANGLADALSITDGSADIISINTSGGTNVVAITGNLTVSGTIAADTAAVATAVTITDNESTNEDNAIIFTSGGDVDGGDIQLESDGTLNYNPSTGTLTSTVFAGNLTGNASGSAATLATARAIAVSGDVTGTANFDGSAAISISSTIANDAVSLAKMAGLTRGSMIIGDSSGNPSALVKGSANYVLTSDGTDIAWAAASGGSMTSFQLEDDSGDEVAISNAKEVKFIGDGLTINWTDTDNGTDGDPYDLTFSVDAAQTGITSIYATDLVLGEDAQTKIDFETANEIHFDTDNAERLLIDATGKVGIGIAGPDSNLHIHNATAGTIASASNTVLTVENNNSAIIQILTPAANVASINFGSPTSNERGVFQYNHNTDFMHWNVGAATRMSLDSGTLYIGDTAHGQMTQGLVINQGNNTDNILALKFTAGSYNTGITSGGWHGTVDTDDYLVIRPQNINFGGAAYMVFAENDAEVSPMTFHLVGGTANTTKSTSGTALVQFNIAENNGSNDRDNVTADGNIFGVKARRGGASPTVWLLDEDGDTWQDGGATFNGTVTVEGADVGKGVAKASCTIPSAGNALDANSYNMAGITDTGTGDRLLEFDTDFSAITGLVCIAQPRAAFNDNDQSHCDTAAVGTVKVVHFRSGTATDAPQSFVAFGDQ